MRYERGINMAKIGYFERNEKIRMDGGLDDSQIRQAVKGLLGQNTTIIEEFQILRNTVVDIGVIGVNAFSGYEIKSSFDTLEKLHEQMSDYIRFFHKVEVFTTKHLTKDVETVLSIPEFSRIGIVIAYQDERGKIHFKRHRESYRIEHTKAHYDFVFSMTGLDSKLRPYLKELREKWGIVGERNGK